jgi:DNA-binding transcriptional LysR family regulator
VLLRQLEYLAALAREQHFARAARTCHVSQPSLSEGIRKLERELDVPIVRRGRRFEGFTPEGERVIVWARRILAEQEALHQDLARMRSGVSGLLRVGAIPTALTTASLLTAAFCEAHPRARVSLESMSSRAIVRGLADYELDAALVYLDGEPLGSGRTVPLYRERYLLLTPVDGEFAGRESVSWSEVSKAKLCLLSRAMRNRRILDQIFTEAGATVTPSIETDSVAALYAHVATHRWSSVIAHAWLHMFGVPEGMRVVPLEPTRRSPRVGLVLAGQDPEPILGRALVETARHADVRGTLDELLRRHLDPAARNGRDAAGEA